MKHNIFLISMFLSLIAPNVFGQNGQLHFQILDKDVGRFTPARLTVLQDGKPFKLDIESNLNIAVRNHVVYTASGTGVFNLAPGDYELWFSKGMEYTVDVQTITIVEDKNVYISAHLEKAINTRGFISGDMHLHTLTNSGHGDANLIERVISCAAEGLEWVVATDHNYITDYRPYLDTAGLTGVMTATVGNEVSTSIGHFNTFPLKVSEKPVATRFKEAQILFDNIRTHSGSGTVIQVNHPREVAPFFSLKGLDPFFGTINNPSWSWDFDAFEVLNANRQTGWKMAPHNPQSVIRDWYNILNHNIRITGLGNSDSHTVIGNFAGVPRNYIKSGTDIPSEINENELSENVRAQQVIVGCGLFPKILINNESAMGGTFQTQQGKLKLRLQVQAAPWVSCSNVHLIRNGVAIKSFQIPPREVNSGAMRLDTIIQIQPKRDSWYLLTAHGDEDMYPMVGTLDLPSYPSGFTNPIWIRPNEQGSFKSIFKAAETLVGQKKSNHALLLALNEEPDLIPSVLFHIFNTEHPDAISFSEMLYPKLNIDQKMMLFRELSKSNMDSAHALLQKFERQRKFPYEEITLSSYINFPINSSKVDQFKKRKSERLDEQLNFLESNFAFIHSGAVTQKALTGYSKDDKLPNQWTEQEALNTAQFHFPKKEQGSHFLKTNWRMIRDTSLFFYLSTNCSIQIWMNNQELKTVKANNMASAEDKLFELPLRKGANEITLQLSAQEPAWISFHHAENKWLIDPKLKLEEVKHKGLNAKTTFLHESNYKYHGHGIALTDGYRGTEDYANQLWQGWQGENAEVVVDLGEQKALQNISVGVLQSQGAWIFYPKKIEFFTSNDGSQFNLVHEESFVDTSSKDGTQIKTVAGIFNNRMARYVKVIVTPIDQLPDWHKSKGEDAWIFLDEIIIR